IRHLVGLGRGDGDALETDAEDARGRAAPYIHDSSGAARGAREDPYAEILVEGGLDRVRVGGVAREEGSRPLVGEGEADATEGPVGAAGSALADELISRLFTAIVARGGEVRDYGVVMHLLFEYFARQQAGAFAQDIAGL